MSYALGILILLYGIYFGMGLWIGRIIWKPRRGQIKGSRLEIQITADTSQFDRAVKHVQRELEAIKQRSGKAGLW